MDLIEIDISPDSFLHRGPAVAVIICMTGLLAGCASLSSSDDEDSDPSSEDVERIEADPVLIRAQGDDDDIVTERFDAEELFQRAYYAYQSRQYEEAAESYQLIVDHFAGSRFFLPALYNGGLAYEHLQRWSKAARNFEMVIEEFSGTDEAKNAKFRLANAWFELGEYRQVDEFVTQLLLRDDLEHGDRAEAHNLRGRAQLELQEWSSAENSFNNVLQSNLRASESERLRDGHRFIVLAHYGVGRSFHGRMTDVQLVLPTERMRQDLHQKAEYHGRAQGAYIRALREHHHHWSVAAGFHIGKLYEDFYMDMLRAEIPEQFTEEQVSMYFEELREEIEILMDRALRVYERNLSFSQRVAHGEEAEQWVEETAIRLARMRALLNDPMVQRRSEELIVQDEDLEKLWDPTYYARNHVRDALEEAVEVTNALPEPDEVAEAGDQH